MRVSKGGKIRQTLSSGHSGFMCVFFHSGLLDILSLLVVLYPI